jgi:AcrR family transcriptional regulator
MEISDRRPGRPKDEQLSARRTEEILDVAARLFAARGYANTDVQAVADELRVGKGTIYRYFPTKQGLFLASVDRGMHRLMAHIEASMTDADLLKQMEQAIRAYLFFFKSNPEFVELLIQERAEFKDRPKPTYFEHRDADVHKFQARLRSLVAAGRIRDMRLDTITNVVGDLVYGTMFTNHFSGRQRSLDEQADEILEVVLTGLLTDRERCKRMGQKSTESPHDTHGAVGDGNATEREG